MATAAPPFPAFLPISIVWKLSVNLARWLITKHDVDPAARRESRDWKPGKELSVKRAGRWRRAARVPRCVAFSGRDGGRGGKDVFNNRLQYVNWTICLAQTSSRVCTQVARCGKKSILLMHKGTRNSATNLKDRLHGTYESCFPRCSKVSWIMLLTGMVGYFICI